MSVEQSERENAHALEAAVFDFGGVFMASPFDSIGQFFAATGLAPELALAIIFGPYHEDTDHPWHRIERGEITIAIARDEILALGRAQGVEVDLEVVLREIAHKAVLNDAMVAGVRRCRAAGLKTAILTNNIAEARSFWRALMPLEELFDVVVDSCEVGMRKPDARVYRHTLERLGGVPPERAVFLDDYGGNVRAARALGMRAILVEGDGARAIEQLDALLAAGKS
jgi:putative hydrolase of the HAD superfamily